MFPCEVSTLMLGVASGAVVGIPSVRGGLLALDAVAPSAGYEQETVSASGVDRPAGIAPAVCGVRLESSAAVLVVFVLSSLRLLSQMSTPTPQTRSEENT